ncbi:uncharacterized protein BDR25DRAFT_306591 [Lindgomyces ingoldianus]|uniref:Uncharacterized protein n=1 Tax=Lindgomyces ingoldianus TaxID=673940 RepID=A0ACB6QEZ0_9PLEO|nr:uncharacterized protein BDR25DRAFT_306591 [Lindgomyces ingoldianus]KAF2465435.1 hypothetical protein BDR25DRAFT_306591 [Lindgomyces ingoldianus]
MDLESLQFDFGCIWAFLIAILSCSPSIPTSTLTITALALAYIALTIPWILELHQDLKATSTYLDDVTREKISLARVVSAAEREIRVLENDEHLDRLSIRRTEIPISPPTSQTNSVDKDEPRCASAAQTSIQECRHSGNRSGEVLLTCVAQQPYGHTQLDPFPYRANASRPRSLPISHTEKVGRLRELRYGAALLERKVKSMQEIYAVGRFGKKGASVKSDFSADSVGLEQRDDDVKIQAAATEMKCKQRVLNIIEQGFQICREHGWFVPGVEIRIVEKMRILPLRQKEKPASWNDESTNSTAFDHGETC